MTNNEKGALIKARDVLQQCNDAMVYMSEYDIPICLPDDVKQALAELDAFIEGVDVRAVERYIVDLECTFGHIPTYENVIAVQHLLNGVKGGE